MTSPASGAVSADLPTQIQAAQTVKTCLDDISSAMDVLRNKSGELQAGFQGASYNATMNAHADLYADVKNQCSRGHYLCDHVINTANLQHGVSLDGATSVQQAVAGAPRSGGVGVING